MAQYNHTEFATSYLHKCMMHLFNQFKKERDRPSAFTAIGYIALACKSGMAPYLDSILVHIKDGLQARGRKNAPPEASIFQCIAMLAKSVGQVLTKHMEQLLDLMFAFGLSDALVEAAAALKQHIPPLSAQVQSRLLDLLSIILSGEKFRHPGAPRPQPVPLLPASAEPKDPALITLALDTLGSFEFPGHILSELISVHIVSYLGDDVSDVRLAAGLTICKLFATDPVVMQTSNNAIRLVGEVLEKILTVAIADPDPSIRKAILGALDKVFDRHLAQAENVRSLFIAVNDEDFEIRVLAVGLIGRLSNHNPAYVMPSLRKMLIQLLTELEYSTKE